MGYYIRVPHMPHTKSKLLLSGIRVVKKYCSDPVEEPPMLRQMLSKAIYLCGRHGLRTQRVLSTYIRKVGFLY